MLKSIVGAALGDYQNKQSLREEMRKHKKVLGLMDSSNFRFRTLEQAKNLAFFMANCFPDPEAAVYGLSELMINAVEHGNLGITYHEKTELILGGSWAQEVSRRLDHPEYKNKVATLSYELLEDGIQITIQDQGEGFDWQKYIDFTPDRATDPHGRGIATAKMISFPHVEYIGNGNTVRCHVPLEFREI